MKIKEFKLRARASIVDLLNRDKTFNLVKLLTSPTNLPEYNPKGNPKHWITDRNAVDYLRLIFPEDQKVLNLLGLENDPSESEKIEVHHKAGTKMPIGAYSRWPKVPLYFSESRPRFGGVEGFFSSGNTILDLGSGRGIALAQFSQASKAEDIKWIGVDKKYSKDKLNLENREGVQFIYSDLADLKEIPSASVDRILDVQSAFLYGHYESALYGINRVSKKGTILRSSHSFGKVAIDELEILVNMLTKRGWDVYTHRLNTLIARKN